MFRGKALKRPKINKTIHINQFWYSVDGSLILPSFYEDSVELIFRQDYQPILWVYQKLKNIPKGVIVKDANKIIPFSYFKDTFIKNEYFSGSSRISAKTEKKYFDAVIFSDIFRTTLLKKNGGIWFDTDVLLLKKLPKVKNIIATTPRKLEGLQVHKTNNLPKKFNDVYLNNSVIICEKNSKWINEHLRLILDYVDNNKFNRQTDLLKLFEVSLKNTNSFNILAPPILFNPIPYWTYQLETIPYKTFGYTVPSISQIKKKSITISLSGKPLKNHYKEILNKLNVVL
tara:strand:+ start:17137 stop:17994 length:858 start_codon:yes stop_codon:yes gene_type:complete